jgi:hypothetical protein
MDKYQRLQKLADLKERGILSEKEFHFQKQLLLDESASDAKAPQEGGKASNAKLYGGLAIGVFTLVFGFAEVAQGNSTILWRLISLGVAGIAFCVAGLAEKGRKVAAYTAALVLNILGIISLFATY